MKRKAKIIVTFDDKGFPSATLKNVSRRQVTEASNFLNKVSRKPNIIINKKPSKLVKLIRTLHMVMQSNKSTDLKYQAR